MERLICKGSKTGEKSMTNEIIRSKHIGGSAQGLITPTSYYVWLMKYENPLTDLEKVIVTQYGRYTVTVMDYKSSKLLYTKRYAKYVYAEKGYDSVVSKYSNKFYKMFDKWKNQKKFG